MVSGELVAPPAIPFCSASFPHTYDRIRFIAEEERMTTELWKGWAFDGLGELAYAFELLLAAITVVTSCIGVLLCLMGAKESVGASFIERECNSPSEDRLKSKAVPSGDDAQVTIRLEPGYLRLFRRHRYVVTIREGPATGKDREVWSAKDNG